MRRLVRCASHFNLLNRHLAILRAIEENDLTPERLRKITADDDALIAVTMALDKEFREKQKKNK